jgi:peroxiredoxin-like protein
MSDEQHDFHLTGDWTENSNGDGTVTFDWGGTLSYGVSVSLGGKAGRSNPEEMLIAAVVSCYSITLALLIEKRRLTPAPRIEMDADGVMIRNPDRTLKFTELHLKPKIYAAHFDAVAQEKIVEMAHKAEQYCVISNALRGNVEITVSPEIV